MLVLQSNPTLARKTRLTFAGPVTSLPQGELKPQSSAVVPANSDIRSSKSTFWGTTLMVDPSKSASIIPATDASNSNRLALPLLHYTGGGVTTHFTDARDGQFVATGSTEDGRPEQQSVAPSAPLSLGKRKADVVDGSAGGTVNSSGTRIQTSAPNSGPEVGGSSEALRKTQRAAEKAQKKAAKLARKALRDAGQAPDDHIADDIAAAAGDESSRPFDYGSAPSVLHPAKSPSFPTGKRLPFNPYAKSADAAGGLKRSQEFRTGKSTTFRH